MTRKAFTLIELLVVVAVIAILAAIAVPNFLEAQVRSKTGRTYHDMAVIDAGAKAYYADFGVYPPNQRDIYRFLVAYDTARADAPTTPATQAATGGNDPFGGGGADPFGGGFGVYNHHSVDDHSPLRLSTPEDSTLAFTIHDFDPAARSGDAALENSGMLSSHWGHYSLPAYPPLIASSLDLRALTTPIPYIGRALPQDTFSDTRGLPFRYLDLSGLYARHPELIPSGAAPRYLLLSYGPDSDQASAFGDVTDPVRGEFVQYDPTNGTVSQGDLGSLGLMRGP